MTLAAGSNPQGTYFYDPESLTYVGSGRFVMTEERYRQANLFTYAPGTTLDGSGVQLVELDTTVANIGIEGMSNDPLTNGFIAVKEKTPEGIFQTTIDFTAGTTSNGSPTTINSIDLFDPALLGLVDFADVFALPNVTSLSGDPDFGNILVLSQESGKVIETDRNGNVLSTLTITNDLGDIAVVDQQHEGLTMDENGFLYVVSENGGGDINHPQLWVDVPVHAPRTAPDLHSLNHPGAHHVRLLRPISSALVLASLVLVVPAARAAIIIPEVHPSGSGNGAYAADFFEVTNTGASPVDLTGWKMDDNSNSFTSSVAIRGVTSISPGQSIILLAGDATGSNDAAIRSSFLSAWFGANAPVGLVVGAYGGLGVGLSTAGDAVNLFDAAGNRATGVAFGAATTGVTFDNAAGLGLLALTSGPKSRAR